MFQLLVAVMAVALSALLVAGGISYVNFDVVHRIGATQIASTGFRAWEHAYASYRMAYRKAPVMKDDLAPFLQGGIPKTLEGFSWSYGTDGGGAYVCFGGNTYSAQVVDGIYQLANESSRASSLPVSSLSFGADCGDGASASASDGQQSVAVIYHLTQ